MAGHDHRDPRFVIIGAAATCSLALMLYLTLHG